MTRKTLNYAASGASSSRSGRPGDRTPRRTFAEHSLVRVTSNVRLPDGTDLPEGAVGAVVGTWAGGKAYEVEFITPHHAVATIAASILQQDER